MELLSILLIFTPIIVTLLLCVSEKTRLKIAIVCDGLLLLKIGYFISWDIAELIMFGDHELNSPLEILLFVLLLYNIPTLINKLDKERQNM